MIPLDLQAHIFVRCRCVSPLVTQEYQEKLFNVSRIFFTNGDVTITNVNLFKPIHSVILFYGHLHLSVTFTPVAERLELSLHLPVLRLGSFTILNCHNRPSDLRGERSNKMRRRRDKTKG